MRGVALGLFAAVVGVVGCADGQSSPPLGKSVQALSTGLVISQIYGGGSGTGAAFKNDYVELFNRGTTPISLSGLSLQYSRADVPAWTVLPLPADTIQPGKYYLIRVFTQTAMVGADLPTPDFTEAMADGGTSANYGTNSGLVALVTGNTPLTCGVDAGPCTSTTMVDFVAYGSGDTVRPPTTWEGSGAAPRPAGTTQGVWRKGGGCQETDDNANDFEVITVGTTGPGPRNSATAANPCTAGVVISQIYGGGSATSATYKHDYVELFNRASVPVALTGMSLQYSRADASTWTVMPLPAVVMQPGRYFLIRVFSPTTLVGADLPTPDLVETSGEGGTGANYGTNSGLVALVNDTTPLTCGFDAGPCSTGSIVDFVGYGAGDTVRPPTVYETAPAPRPANATQAVTRKNGGCVETNNNSTDFELLTASARNSTSPANSCGVVSDAGTDAGDDSATMPDVATTTDAADGGDTATGDATSTDSVVEDTATQPDTEPLPDTAVADTSAPADTSVDQDTGTAPTDEVLEDDGCGCRMPGSDHGSRNAATAFGIIALGTIAARLRRRR